MSRNRERSDCQTGYQPAGIYGWRKQCLYAVILFIFIVVMINLALTVWILRVLNFNIEGLNMGTIMINSKGITVGGRTDIVKTMHASNISATQNIALSITSNRDIIFRSENSSDSINNKLHIGKRGIDATCESFEVRDLSGNSRFKVTEKGVTYGVDEVTYSGKAVFNGSIETPNIRGPRTGSLRLESASSSILISGRERVYIEAPVGNIEMTSSSNIDLLAKKRISLNSTYIRLPNVAQFMATGSDQTYDEVFQLCMCQNGRLFLAPSAGQCVTEKRTCS